MIDGFVSMPNSVNYVDNDVTLVIGAFVAIIIFISLVLIMEPKKER